MATVKIQSDTGLDTTSLEIDGSHSIGAIREQLGARYGITSDMVAIVDNAQVTNGFELGADSTVEFRPGQKARG